MIGRLHGVLREKSPPQVVIEVNGIGYEVDVPMSTFYNLPALSESVTLFTHLSIREDGHFLYGFITLGERSTFRTLIRISGVGPKMALAILSGLSVQDLAQVVVHDEAGRLEKIPGVGKKTAARLLLELKGKLDLPMKTGMGSRHPDTTSDALHALTALGYGEKEAVLAMRDLPHGLSVVDAIRQALKNLSRL
ncbi:MAG: Holliday junction branch migration protein RuvA [Proteobacteria bacterium]|nr:Holliday junction branch migration protein RuvA [Pseudomonadota bacterium]MDE3208691.1 Holliday junction branch migration protein RuvA [Pseudomonadota bacterium]